MTQAVTYFGRTMKQGVTGVIMKPMAGARNKGVFGMATGVGKGIVGCVAAPVAGEGEGDRAREPSRTPALPLGVGV